MEAGPARREQARRGRHSSVTLSEHVSHRSGRANPHSWNVKVVFGRSRVCRRGRHGAALNRAVAAALHQHLDGGRAQRRFHESQIRNRSQTSSLMSRHPCPLQSPPASPPLSTSVPCHSYFINILPLRITNCLQPLPLSVSLALAVKPDPKGLRHHPLQSY